MTYRNQSGGSEEHEAGLEDLGDQIMTIRTWQELEHSHSFRARITYGRAFDNRNNTITATDPAEVLQVVGEWLASQRGGMGT